MGSQDVEITWNGDAATKRARAGAVQGLQLGTQLILAESVKIVPLDEATLQDSGKAEVDEANLTGTVSFDTPYAVVQHEDLTLNHPNGREAKYLEKPWLENRNKVQQIIGNTIKNSLGT